jgi:uncharacterized protein DUF3142
MVLSKKLLIALLALLSVVISLVCFVNDSKSSYWIWGWDDLDYISSDSFLIVYQGDYLLPGESNHFVYRGISATESLKNHRISLLIRVYSIKKPGDIIEIIKAIISKWEHKGVEVSGIQLDYDSPSSGLHEYANFVSVLHEYTRVQNIELSVTGLVTWLLDNNDGTKELSRHIEYIVYQLYNNYHPLDNIEKYFSSIQSINYPYMIGITTSEKFHNIGFPKNALYKGKIVFLNK